MACTSPRRIQKGNSMNGKSKRHIDYRNSNNISVTQMIKSLGKMSNGLTNFMTPKELRNVCDSTDGELLQKMMENWDGKLTLRQIYDNINIRKKHRWQKRTQAAAEKPEQVAQNVG